MTYDKGIKRFQQGNTLWMAASGAAGTSFGKGKDDVLKMLFVTKGRNTRCARTQERPGRQ